MSVNFKSSNIRDSHPLNTISSNQPLIQSQTYAQATIGQFSHHKSPPRTPSISLQLSNFLNEFKLLINPLNLLLTKIFFSLLDHLHV